MASNADEKKLSEIPVQSLVPTAKKCANTLLNADSVLLASHIDADGLTAAGIAASALERSEIPFETTFCKQLNEEEIEKIAATDHDTVLFTDFGSGQLNEITTFEDNGDFTPVISDHHEPAEAETEYHLNPLLFDIDGSSELSGAGTTYVLSRCMEVMTNHNTNGSGFSNKDLSKLAIIGAVGDMQSGPEGLDGANKEIVEEAEEVGVVSENKDITLYGKQTRPIPKLLEYSTDVRIPGITGSEEGSINFLRQLDIDLTDDEGEWKHWVDTTKDEKKTIINNLINKGIENGVPADRLNKLVGTTYELNDEETRTSLRDTSEFSTLLNATARYERQDIGLAVCLGDREEAYQEAKTLLRNHQKNISQGVEWVSENGVTHESNLQWFDAEDNIKETIVGIIAGMSFGEGNVKRDRPIIAFADKEQSEMSPNDAQENTEDEVKVSSRGNRTMTRKGLDLSVVMGKASNHVGGDGGGHDVAAGASIPADQKEQFIEKADEIISDQF